MVTSVDSQTGRVTYRPDIVNAKLGAIIHSCPASFGAHNWQAMSYDERGSQLIIPLLQMCGSVSSLPVEFKIGGGGLGGDLPNLGDPSEHIEMPGRTDEHTSERPSLMRISYAVFCLKKK